MTQSNPPRWTKAEFQRDRDRAVRFFRARRLREPVEKYRKKFEEAAEDVMDVMRRTHNLTDDLSGQSEVSLQLLVTPKLRTVLRYLTGPPISEDDLKTLADAPSLAPGRLDADADTVRAIMAVIHASLDIKRFPWAAEGWMPDDEELHAAIVASASLLATQRMQTARRNTEKEEQEGRVKHYFRVMGLKEVGPRKIGNLTAAPGAGEFCGECLFDNRKADIVVRLQDGRVMPIECKVSNSAVNSVKRLNNDAAAKAVSWIDAFGKKNVVPSVVLSGVFDPQNLWDAQKVGLTIFWSHNLVPLTKCVS